MFPKYYKILILFLLGVLSLNLVSCNAGSPKIAAAKIEREIAQSIEPGVLEQQVTANNDFAFDLYRSLQKEPGNLFYSPYSVSLALAMAYAGARTQTEQEMSTTLHYLLPQDQLHPFFNALDQSLNTSASDDAGFQLNVVNSLWGQEQFPFLQDFLDLIARNYGAGVRLVDFTSDAKRELARQTINDWVSQQTKKRIEELLPQGMLNELTRLVLVNAIYFKGEWVDPFENGTRDTPFFLLDGQPVTVPMMSRRTDTPYFEGDGFQAVALPYKGDRVEMIVIMPEPGKFSEFEQTLDQALFDSILVGLHVGELKLYMPKFSFEYSQDLNETLSAMGMPAAFDPGRADFSGIYDQSVEPNKLFISHIAHKAFVAVDEKGTEAAAATGVIMEIESMPETLHIDHPFIFVIRDRQTGSILFVGRLLDPSPAR